MSEKFTCSVCGKTFGKGRMTDLEIACETCSREVYAWIEGQKAVRAHDAATMADLTGLLEPEIMHVVRLADRPGLGKDYQVAAAARIVEGQREWEEKRPVTKEAARGAADQGRGAGLRPCGGQVPGLACSRGDPQGKEGGGRWKERR